MDWYGALWSPLWFIWDLVNNFIILRFIRKWTKEGVVNTKDQVLDEFKNPENAKAIKSAMDIPDRKDLEELQEKIDRGLAAIQESLDASLKELREILEKPPNIEFDTAGIVAALDQKMADRMNGRKGAAASETKAEYKAALAEYEEEGGADLDAEEAAGELVKHGCPRMLARILARRGPKAIEGWLRDQVGPKEAMEIMRDYRRSKMTAGAGVAEGAVGW